MIMKAGKRVILTLLILILAVIVALTAQRVLGKPSQQSAAQAQVTWEVELPSELQGRLYEIAIVPGEPQVIATSPEAIWRIAGPDKLEQILRLESDGQGGESAILAGDGSRAGILTHQQHAIVGFRLVDLTGNILARLEQPRQFHYRISPRGDSFVGIDAAGEHVQVKADRFVYTFYDDNGRVMAEVTSERPQSSDSAYTTDGGAFLVSNANGLFAYRISNGEPLWHIPKQAKSFSAANTETLLAVVSDAQERNVVEANRAGESLWRFTLERNVRNLTLSPNGEYTLATDGNTAHMLTPGSRTPIWSFTMPDKELTINAVAVNDRGVVALGAQHSELSQGLVVILDADGKSMFERELKYELSNAWIPGVQFDLSGSLVLIRTLEELILLATG